MEKNTINERAQRLLKILIERYISDGVPVASGVLAKDSDLSLSPATIRHVMADLEERGYLHSPHTSAGRIPTPQGYRFFINTLIQVKPLNNNLLEEFQQQLTPDKDKQTLLKSTTQLLSGITQLASIVTLPRTERLILRHVEFLLLSRQRLLVILVVNEKEVQNRIIQIDRTYTASELEQVSHFLTETFAGQDLNNVHQELINAMRQDREKMNQFMVTAIEVADKAFETDQTDSDCLISGQANLLDLASDKGISQLRELFAAFTEKQAMLSLVDKCLSAQGLQIFVGEESGYSVFEGCSLITAPYGEKGQAVGMLGVIGPTRMYYDEVIPLVDVTAKLLSAALN